jgi:hypothetical protein
MEGDILIELTLTLDESSVKNAQRVAEHRHTTLDSLVEQFFEQLTLVEDPRHQQELELFEQSFCEVSRRREARSGRIVMSSTTGNRSIQFPLDRLHQIRSPRDH